MSSITLYKITHSDWTTGLARRDQMTWGPGVTRHRKEGIHAYTHPLIAALLNSLEKPILWRARGKPIASGGLGVYCLSLRTVHGVHMPRLSKEYCAEVAIRAAASVYHDVAFQAWASQWLSGSDRSYDTAFALRLAVHRAWDDASSDGRYDLATAALSAEYAITCALREPAGTGPYICVWGDPTAYTTVEALRLAVKVMPKLDVIALLEQVAERCNTYYEK